MESSKLEKKRRLSRGTLINDKYDHVLGVIVGLWKWSPEDSNPPRTIMYVDNAETVEDSKGYVAVLSTAPIRLKYYFFFDENELFTVEGHIKCTSL